MLGASFCREHGGSAVYVHKSVEYKSRNKINRLSIKNVIECVAVECKWGDIIVIIISVYRPPSGNIEPFLNTLENMLCNIEKEDKKVLIAGDFNIELLKFSKIEQIYYRSCRLLT